MKWQLDHLAVCAATLAEGVDYVENLLGVALAPGGQHPHMGTHNRLLSLGPDAYLEVIAIDPQAKSPGRPRWFDLDNFTGAPRLTNWILRTDDLMAALAGAPAGLGELMALQRGDLSWEMAVPKDGRLPFDGAYPGLISWHGDAHPAARLPDSGFRLRALRVQHPAANDLKDLLEPNIDLTQIDFATGAVKKLSASISGPNGDVVL